MSDSPCLPAVANVGELLAAKDCEIAELQRQLEHWRTRAIIGWAAGTGSSGQAARVADLEAELAAMRQTISWRVTAPLRVARGPLSLARRVARRVTGH